VIADRFEIQIPEQISASKMMGLNYKMMVDGAQSQNQGTQSQNDGALEFAC